MAVKKSKMERNEGTKRGDETRGRNEGALKRGDTETDGETKNGRTGKV